jgi:hypothetical protein
MTPYTTRSIDQVRHLCQRGWPPGAVAVAMGWDMGFLRRMCERHGIKFPAVKKKIPKEFKLDEVEWDGKQVTFRGRCVRLSGMEGRIFAYVFKTPGEGRTLASMQRGAHVTMRNVVPGIERTRDALKPLGLTLSRWGYDIELV